MVGRFPNMIVTDEPIYNSEKGANSGVATLDALGKIPISQLPASIIGSLSYQGTWNATTNVPILASGVGTKGFYYVVNISGNTNLDGINDWLIGDWAVFNGTVWEKIDNTDAVSSVFGRLGTVLPANGDYTTDLITETPTRAFITPANNVKLGFITVTANINLDNIVSFPEAPNDGLEYPRKNLGWVSSRLQTVTNSAMLALVTPYIGQQVFNTTWGQVYTFDGDVWLTPNLVKAINQNGSAMVVGNTVIQHSTTTLGVDMTTTPSSIAIIGVVKDIYGGGLTGQFITIAVSGEHEVLCTGAISRGNDLIQSSTLGQSNSTGFGATGIFAITRESQASGVGLIKSWIQPTERF